MSRTFHQLPTTIFRHQKVQNRRKGEEIVIESVKEEGIIPKNFNRIKAYWSMIPEPWNDHIASCRREYHNKSGLPVWRIMKNIFKNRRRAKSNGLVSTEE